MIKFCILLATYNGSAFIREQVESILQQDIQDWVLLIRDDQSNDNTLKILKALSLADKRIRIINDENGPSGSAKSNFSYLMQHALDVPAEFYSFCDQDDVWLPNKLSAQYALLKAYSSDSPVLVHHDLVVVDNELNVIHKSFKHILHLDTDTNNPASLYARNCVTGCTMSCNRILLEYATPVPKKIIMHDWWLAQVAATLGKITYDEQAYILYRQHQNNSVGAQTFWSGLNPTNNWLRGWERGNKEFVETIEQAASLHQHLLDLNTVEPLHIQKTYKYATVLHRSVLQRLTIFYKNKLFPKHPFLALMTILRLITIPKTT